MEGVESKLLSLKLRVHTLGLGMRVEGLELRVYQDGLLNLKGTLIYPY